jgi:hypothetical protein
MLPGNSPLSHRSVQVQFHAHPSGTQILFLLKVLGDESIKDPLQKRVSNPRIEFPDKAALAAIPSKAEASLVTQDDLYKNVQAHPGTYSKLLFSFRS